MRQYTRPPVMKWPVNSLAKELGFCFDQNNWEPPMYCLSDGQGDVFSSRSLEEINGYLLGFKYSQILNLKK